MRELNFTVGMTHAGVFHADEVFASAILKLLFPDITFKRVFRVPLDVSSDTIVYDIGGGQYDHHQRGGNGCRGNGIPFSSAGLIWHEFGHLLTSSQEAADDVDRRLIEGIDAVDNGVVGATDISVMSVSGVISGFNPTWDSDTNPDVAFEEAVSTAIVILTNVIDAAESKCRAKELVNSAIEASKDGIMVLDRFVPWQEYLLNHENGENILFVVFPSNRGGYNVQAVPVSLGSFETRKMLPEPWRGLPETELREASGLLSASFIHPAGFIGGCEKLNDAMMLASAAIAW